MKIFFLTQFYFNLHKPILDEMERQGHQVFLERDVFLPLDPNIRSKTNRFKGIKRLLRKVLRIEKRFWQKKIQNNPTYNEKYDLLLCINGTSFCPFLLDHLRKINPDIKASLYLWDTNKYYDFFRYNYCFDRVLTFDLDDAANCPGVEVLHSYWFPSQPREIKYKLFVVGADHDDRIDIVSKVYRQLQEANLPSFLRIVLNKPKPIAKLYMIIGYRKKYYTNRLDDWNRKRDLPFTVEEKIPVDKILEYIDESECILDTDMPIQTGATERVIWSLARGKKIISTNYNLKNLPFYNEEQIRFIDRKNPIIDIDFLKERKVFPVCPEIQELRVDKWIHRLIDFK